MSRYLVRRPADPTVLSGAALCGKATPAIPPQVFRQGDPEAGGSAVVAACGLCRVTHEPDSKHKETPRGERRRGRGRTGKAVRRAPA